MVNHREEIQATAKFKTAYLNGIEALILDRQRKLAQERAEYCKDIFTTPETYRNDFKKMLGWPLIGYADTGLPKVTSTKLAEEETFSIYRMQFEILAGVELTGLYFEQKCAEKKPLVLVQHGKCGTPERVSGLYDGDTSNYNHMLERVIDRGVHAFVPQLLLWDEEKYGIDYDRGNIDARLKRVGGSITALELYGLTKVLDYFETKDNISGFGMVGLSYGGFYTLFLSALDTRIKSAISCSFFNTRDQHPWNDWTWFGAASKFDDAEIAAMTYPRKLCIELGVNDGTFDVQYGKQSYERLVQMCKDVGTDWLTFITFDGEHEFCKFDEPIEALVKDLL